MKNRGKLARGSSPLEMIMYLAIFTVAFYVLVYIYDYIQWEKARRQGKHRQVEQVEDQDYGPHGYSFTQ